MLILRGPFAGGHATIRQHRPDQVVAVLDDGRIVKLRPVSVLLDADEAAIYEPVRELVAR